MFLCLQRRLNANEVALIANNNWHLIAYNYVIMPTIFVKYNLGRYHFNNYMKLPCGHNILEINNWDNSFFHLRVFLVKLVPTLHFIFPKCFMALLHIVIVAYISNEERPCFFHLVPFSLALVDTADRPGTVMDTSIMASSECYLLAATPFLSLPQEIMFCLIFLPPIEIYTPASTNKKPVEQNFIQNCFFVA